MQYLLIDLNRNEKSGIVSKNLQDFVEKQVVCLCVLSGVVDGQSSVCTY